ncbi:hypothetical protein JAAARDRAFT_184571 [Jaapia argillacea MUCL 33604]|uniref:Uncharacterized protein n=1 Tax=Jaapia argillacea MUCL 33604 TaxID=933084 RepID=A0A067PLV1_9AGAM|nr:hypothetical protein JAAARDRAFT_184571 [Jaapia argillacea MUCL 33604]
MVVKVLQLSLITTLLIATAVALPIPRAVVCVPTTWSDIAVFFVANYIAHATTIPTAPGANWYDTAAWTMLSLLLPFAGLGKSLGLILSHFIAGNSDLEKAWAHDALAVVVRSDDWEPADDPEEICIKLPRGFHEIEESFSTLPSATIVFDRGRGFERVAIEHVQIHGRMVLPKGYHLAYPASRVAEMFPFNSPVNKRALLSRSQSWLKMAVSIAQLCYSSATVYQTRGSQLDQYGYAAFGLSVFPYAFMSLANLICVGLVGEYPSLYLLRTRIMDEAEERGGLFNGAVGSWREKKHPCVGQRHAHESAKSGCWGAFSLARLSIEVKGLQSDEMQSKEDEGSQEILGLLEEDGDSLQKILVVTTDEVTRRFVYQPRKGSATHVFTVSSWANQDHIPDGGYVHAKFTQARGWIAFGGLLIATLASLILPYIVIFIFSRFEAGRSTIAQRGWMMAWASSGQLALLSFGLVNLYFSHFSLSTWEEAAKNSAFGRGWIPRLVLPSLILLPIPAIGGFVAVGRMLKEFGTCSLVPVCG